MTTRRGNDDGFMLIELMVVVLILGVLAGIAFPALAGQKGRARTASMQASLRDAATFQEARVAGGLDYAPAGRLDLLEAEGFRVTGDVLVTIVDDDMGDAGHGFCLRAQSPGAPTLYYASTGADKKISEDACAAS
jgi:prepilin-type N-terminal cleavage/methylation domain-containing protein